MLSVLAAGKLIAAPVSRTSAAGKAYATCLLLAPAEDGEPILVSIIAFDDDAVAALLALANGESCAIAGRARLTSWQKGGKDNHGISVVADRVLSAYAAGKVRKAARETEAA